MHKNLVERPRPLRPSVPVGKEQRGFDPDDIDMVGIGELALYVIKLAPKERELFLDKLRTAAPKR